MKEQTTISEKPTRFYYNMDVLSTLREINGKNASNGHNGRNGVNGINGHNGENGRNGSNGENGENGHNGKNGINGKNGTDGTDGISPSPLEPYITNRIYHAGDVVYFNGGTYVVTATQTTGSPDTAPDEYELISSPGTNGIGLQNTRNYVAGMTYQQNDTIYFNGSLYLVTAPSTSGNPDTTPGDFRLLIERGAPGISVTNTVTYTPQTTYFKNQFIYYNGSNYLVTADETSSSPDEAPEDYELIIKKGADGADLRTLVTYDPSTTYVKNNLVYDNGSTYLVTAEQTSGRPDTNPDEYLLIAREAADGAHIPELQEYTAGTTYTSGDIVYYNGSTYVVTANSVTASPAQSPTSYFLAAQAGTDGVGLDGVVNYTPGTVYPKNTVIFYQGSTYMVTAESTSASPTVTPADYRVIAAKGNNTSSIVTFTTGGPITLTIPVNDYFSNSAYVGSVAGIPSTTDITLPINFTNTPQLTTAYTVTIPLCGTLTSLQIWLRTLPPAPAVVGGGFILANLVLADVGSFTFRRISSSSVVVYGGSDIPAGLTLTGLSTNINQNVSPGQKLMLAFYIYSAGPTDIETTFTFSALASATITGYTCP